MTLTTWIAEGTPEDGPWRAWRVVCCALALAGAAACSSGADVADAANEPPLANPSAQISLSRGSLTAAWDDAASGGLEGLLLPQSAVVLVSGSPHARVLEGTAVSEPGDSATLTGLVTDAAGDRLVLWEAEREYRRGTTCRARKDFSCAQKLIGRGTWYAWLPARASASVSVRVRLPSAVGAQVAMDDRGDSIIAYRGEHGVYVRRGNARGEFGAPIDAVPGGAGLVRVWLDAAGEAMLLVEQKNGRIAVSFGASGRSFSPLQVLGGRLDASSLVAVAAVGSAGEAVVGWQDLESTHVAYRPPGGRFGRSHTLAGVQPLAADAGPRGQARLVVERTDEYTPRIQVVQLGVGGPSRPVTVARAGGGALTTVAAGDGVGDLIIATEGTARASETTLEVLRSSAGRRLGKAEVVGSFYRPAAIRIEAAPAVAVRDGSFAVAWIPTDQLSARYEYPLFEIRTWQPMGRPFLPLLPPPPLIPRYAPASNLELGEVARPDSHGMLHGTLECGSEEPGPCWVNIEIVLASASRTRLAVLTRTVNPSDRASRVAVQLSAAARRVLAQRRHLSAIVVTATKSGNEPPTRDEFPIVLARAIAPRHSG